jgi:chromate transporter
MQHDAVTTYHFMTASQFLNAVALGQLTPGPVVQTVAVDGYAARGLAGGLLAAFVAFTPSFLFVLVGGPRFDQLRKSASVQSFLTGAGPAVIGAIAGSAIPLGMLLHQPWQVVVALSALAWLFVVRRGVVSALLLAGIAGVGFALWGLPV